MTLNEIISLLESISDSHLQVKYFGNGELWDINGIPKTKPIYPSIWAQPLETTNRLQTQEYTIRLLCYDLVNVNNDNQTEVLSDCLQILNDFVKVFRNQSNDYYILNDPTMIHFTERFNDEVTGWYCDIILQVQYPSNYCDLPINLNNI